MARKDRLGRAGEQAACDYLTARGYRVLDRNWRCEIGEVDIVAQHAGRVVFVEVKTRSSSSHGHPFEAITPAKLERLRLLASAWCRQAGAPRGRARIDAVAVSAPPGGPVTIEHRPGVF